MTHEKFLEKLEAIKTLVENYSNLFEEKELIKLASELEDKIKKSAKWPKNISPIITKIKRKNTKTIKTLAEQTGIQINTTNKWAMIFEIGVKLIENNDLAETLKTNLETKKKKTKKKRKTKTEDNAKTKETTTDAKETIMKWLDMNEEQLRQELENMKVKEIREITKNILPYNIRRKKKKDLIDAIIFKINEIKHHFKMGPA